MTDEAYIDDLFAREGIGWDQTPGFRAFVLDLMGIIGERPRAGDVASMHMAYRHGMEYAPTWTTDRPTEPGEYWLSMPPDSRYPNQPRVREAYVYESQRCMVTLDFEASDAYEPMLVVGGNDEAGTWPDNSSDILSVQDTRFDGAKWSRRETPADPFEVTK